VAFAGVVLPGMIDQNTAHQAARQAEKVAPVLPIDLIGAAEANVHLVDQSGGLKGMVRPFAAHAGKRQPV